LTIKVGKKEFNVVDFGAEGDGKTMDTGAIQKAFDAAAENGGGIVLFPSKGNFLTKALQFTGSHTLMRVERGAQILFNNEKCVYPQPQSGKVDNLLSAGRRRSQVLTDIGIDGGGIINGQGKTCWDLGKKELSKKEHVRPKMIFLDNMNNVLVTNIITKDPPKMHMMVHSDDSEVSHVTMMAPPSESSEAINGTEGPSHNTDGINVMGQNVYLHHLNISTGDDNIAFHGNDTWVEDSFFGRGHGLSIGSVVNGNHFRNITVRNSVMQGTTTGFRIKVKSNVKQARVHDVTLENVTLFNVHQSVFFTHFYSSARLMATGSCNPFIYNITLNRLHVVLDGTAWPTAPGGFKHPQVMCTGGSPCIDLNFTNITFENRGEEIKDMKFELSNAFGVATNNVPEIPMPGTDPHCYGAPTVTLNEALGASLPEPPKVELVAGFGVLVYLAAAVISWRSWRSRRAPSREEEVLLQA